MRRKGKGRSLGKVSYYQRVDTVSRGGGGLGIGSLVCFRDLMRSKSSFSISEPAPRTRTEPEPEPAGKRDCPGIHSSGICKKFPTLTWTLKTSGRFLFLYFLSCHGREDKVKCENIFGVLFLYDRTVSLRYRDVQWVFTAMRFGFGFRRRRSLFIFNCEKVLLVLMCVLHEGLFICVCVRLWKESVLYQQEKLLSYWLFSKIKSNTTYTYGLNVLHWFVENNQQLVDPSSSTAPGSHERRSCLGLFQKSLKDPSIVLEWPRFHENVSDCLKNGNHLKSFLWRQMCGVCVMR